MSITAPTRKSRHELQATAQGLVSQSVDRSAMASTQLMIGGTAYLMLLGLRAGDVVTNVYVVVTGSGGTVTLFKAGVYSKDAVTQYAVSADQSGLFASTGTKTVPLTAPWTCPVDDAYGIVVVSTATTLPTLLRGGPPGGNPQTQIGSNPRPFAVAGTSLTDLPAAGAVLSHTNSFAYWVGVS